MGEKITTFSGIGFWGLLTIAFIVLKLCGVITWKWIWVLSPLWINIALVLVVILVALVVYGVMKIMERG